MAGTTEAAPRARHPTTPPHGHRKHAALLSWAPALCCALLAATCAVAPAAARPLLLSLLPGGDGGAVGHPLVSRTAHGRQLRQGGGSGVIHRIEAATATAARTVGPDAAGATSSSSAALAAASLASPSPREGCFTAATLEFFEYAEYDDGAFDVAPGTSARSPDACAAWAAGEGYTVFALRRGSWCFGTTQQYLADLFASDGDAACDAACDGSGSGGAGGTVVITGSSGDSCGGEWGYTALHGRGGRSDSTSSGSELRTIRL